VTNIMLVWSAEPNARGGLGMAAIPKKVAERLVVGLKRYQPILAAAKARDVGEADTVTIIKDVLADVFGYDKYSDVTSERCIRGTYYDLGIRPTDISRRLLRSRPSAST
jgi:hypothetical protein